MTTLIQNALLFATAAHAAVGQVRKYTDGEPYVLHPIAVAEIVKSVPHDDAMVAAALLHDVVEDTAVSIDLIREVFGEDVADLVDWLTKPSKFFEQHDPYDARLARAPARAQTIKVADILDNIATLTERDPKRAKSYLPKKLVQVQAMERADPGLRQKALRQLRGFEVAA